MTTNDLFVIIVHYTLREKAKPDASSLTSKTISYNSALIYIVFHILLVFVNIVESIRFKCKDMKRNTANVKIAVSECM